MFKGLHRGSTSAGFDVELRTMKLKLLKMIQENEAKKKLNILRNSTYQLLNFGLEIQMII